MGNYNPNTPAARGQETQYAWSWEVSLTNPLQGVLERFRPGATTITHGHLCLPTVKGASGLHIAVIDEKYPAVTYTDFYPGTNTGRTNTGWTGSFGDIDDPHGTTFSNYTAASGVDTKKSQYYRGNNAGALAGRRILRVQVQALLLNRRNISTGLSGNSQQIPAQGVLVINGIKYYGNFRHVPKMDAYQLVPDLGDWYLNPETGLPWTQAAADDLIDSADADAFGFDSFGKSDADGFRCRAMWLRVYHCDENRLGLLDTRAALRRGWDRYALGGPDGGALVAASANTHYWLELGGLASSLANYFSLAAVWPMDESALVATDNTKDHRETNWPIFTGPGGVGSIDRGTDQEHIAFLLEAAGPTILASSQAYAATGEKDLYDNQVANVGTQITTDSSQPAGGYAGVTLTLAPKWEWGASLPLIIEVRHGAGAISGGGTLDATATLRPEDCPPGAYRKQFVPFDAGNVTLSNSTQYHVLVRSSSDYWWAWTIPYQDSRSDLRLSTSGTTVANIEGATQGGQTDSYVEGGVAYDRYELPIALTAPPAPPASITVTAFDAEPNEADCVATLPPRLRATWAATALGSAFSRYHVWVQPYALPLPTPVLVGDLYVPDPDAVPATDEVQLTEHWITEAGWAVLDAAFAEGWRVGVSVVNKDNRLESGIRWATLTNEPSTGPISWLCSDAARWLSTPLFAERGAQSDALTEPTVYDTVGGRDHAIVRVPGTIPGRRYRLQWDSERDYPDESILRGPRAAATTGRQMALLRCRGDRAFGVLFQPSTSIPELGIEATADFVTTSGDPAVAGPNMLPGYVLNGTTQYVYTPDSALLDPGTSAFTVLFAGKVPNAASKFLLAKSQGVGVSDGYGFFTNAGPTVVQFNVDGVTNAATLTDPIANWTDGYEHVAVGTSDGTAQEFYRDGELVDTDTVTTGSVSNALALAVGVRGDLAAGFTALTGNVWGMWARKLTEDEVVNATRYLLGHAGYRMPPGANIFIDVRDSRSHGQPGTLLDLSGNVLNATVVATPYLRGVPWRLEELDRKH